MEMLEDHSIVRVERECTVTSATELKELLLQALASGTRIDVDLSAVEEIDVTALQLLWAARNQARSSARGFTLLLSETAAGVAAEAGFDLTPRPADRGAECPR
jgi:anti-anti-sigma regulatory factor